MKVVVMLALLCVGLFAKDLNYSAEVISLFLTPNDTRVSGRLLPTNGFSIIEESKDRIKISLDGFVNPKAPFVLYYNDRQRIIVAAFSKNTKLNFKKRIAGKGGKWDKVSLEVWAEKGNFERDDKDMLHRAQNIYLENCGICHTAHKEQEFTANQWAATFKSMVDRTGIDKKDRWLITQYLQKNSKDSKETK